MSQDMELFILFSRGQNIDHESPLPYKPVRKKIAKPAKLILFLHIIMEIKIKRIEETNREMSKGHEQFTGKKICMSLKDMKKLVIFTHNNGLQI